MTYQIGDIVRVFYPFVPKNKQEQILKQVAQYNEVEQPVFFEGKSRYGVVVGLPDNRQSNLSIVQIMSHGDETEKKGYKLRDDELKVPENLFVERKGELKELTGVIKMERIETFAKDEVSAPLTSIPLFAKQKALHAYESIMVNPYYENKLNDESPNHQWVMKEFKESIIAEKLQFLTDSFGSHHYDALKRNYFFCDQICKIGRMNDHNIYAVELQGVKHSFSYTIATKKDEDIISNDWHEPKPAVYWLKQDSKFHVLERNIQSKIRPDPPFRIEQLIPFDQFKEDVINKNRMVIKKNAKIER